MKLFKITLLFIFIFSCKHEKSINKGDQSTKEKTEPLTSISLVVLGTIQDAGSPQIACNKDCCKGLFQNPDSNRQVVSLGLVDGENSKSYLFDATPDMGRQIKKLTKLVDTSNEMVDGIFLTHAHIGHYTGLMFLGKEAMDANKVPVYAMPKMRHFLHNNGPWNQLVLRENITIKNIENEKPIELSKNIKVIPFLVPHRDEYSETVGYKIVGPEKTALFVPDIDKWNKWNKSIVDEIKTVDYAFLDATFYSGKELNNRDMLQIPHPFIKESLETFKDLDETEKKKVIFIHFNHTNPVINPNSEASNYVKSQGFSIAEINNIYQL
jgi:pyrroloquinoline quinone biosynthesis protein B